MATRALGALFALAAALLFATALAGGLVPKVVPGWWDGRPVVQGRELNRKEIHVGLLGAYGCNLSDEVRCEKIETLHALDVVDVAELAALGLGALTALLLAISAARIGDRRRVLAKLVLFEVAVITAGATMIYLHGPDLDIKIQIGVPVGLGLLAAGGGIGAALLATIAALRLRREPLRLRPSLQQQQLRQAQQPAFDVRELLREGQGGTPQRFAGPHVGSVGLPLFESAPALRPLYDLPHAGAPPPARARLTPPPLEEPTAPRVHDPITRGDSASAHAPLSPPRTTDPTEDLEPPPMEPPTLPRRGVGSARVPAPERGSRATKPPTHGHPTEVATAVELDAEAKARHRLATDQQQTTHRRTNGEATGLIVDGADATDDATNRTSSAPERLERDREHDLGFAHTELAALTPQQLEDLPSSEQPPIEPPPPVVRARSPLTKPPAPLSPKPRSSTSVPPPSRPAPPPKPTSLPPASAPVAAPFSPRESAPTIGIERIEPDTRMRGVERSERGAPRSPSLEVASPFAATPSVGPVAPLAPLAPAAPLAPVAPLAAVASRSGPITASRGAPSLRTGKPSVPPPASTSKFTGLSLPKRSAAATTPPGPSEAPERPAAASPFASIPSPFAAKPPPSRPSDEAPTAPATPEHHVAALAEAPTQPASKPKSQAPEVPLPRAPRPEVSMPSDEAVTVHASGSPTPAATAPSRSASTTVQPRPTMPAKAEVEISPRVPISTAPASLPPPKQAIVSGPTPACPQCEAPMAWVEEHLRFYCASCRMYF